MSTPIFKVADHAGACYGVERALQLAHETVSASSGSVYTLGPLIHNPQAVSELAQAGVIAREDLPDQAGETIIIRTHGVAPGVIDEARRRKLRVVDGVCPHVKKVQLAAERLSAEGYDVLVVGEAGHPEVVGILGYAPCARVVATVDDVRMLIESSTDALGEKVGVVAQTTQRLSTFNEIASYLLSVRAEVSVVNTICKATQERQNAAEKLAASADVMLVLGGRNSANTCRLAEICAEKCPHTHHIESPSELNYEWFLSAQYVGITAGASTPQAQIQQLVVHSRHILETFNEEVISE